MEVNGGTEMTEPNPDQPEREIETEPVGTNVDLVEDEYTDVPAATEAADDDRT